MKLRLSQTKPFKSNGNLIISPSNKQKVFKTDNILECSEFDKIMPIVAHNELPKNLIRFDNPHKGNGNF